MNIFVLQNWPLPQYFLHHYQQWHYYKVLTKKLTDIKDIEVTQPSTVIA